MRRRCFEVAFLVVLLAGSAFAQQGVIRGKIRLPSGSTINGVIVELWRSAGLEAHTVSNRDGDFEFAGLIPSSYEVVVKHEGYQQVSERVEFRYERSNSRSEVLSVEINLKANVSSTGVGARPGTTFVQEVPPAARTAFENGIARLKEGKASEGTALLRQATTVFPAYFSAHLALAGELVKEGNQSEALKELEEARLINDRDSRVYQLFGIIMGAQKKYATAEWAFRAAISRDPTDAQSFFSRAIVLIELVRVEPEPKRQDERLAEAERDLSRTIELSGERFPPAYLHRARVLEIRNDRKAAARDLLTYLKLNPDDKNAPAIRAAIEKLDQ